MLFPAEPVQYPATFSKYEYAYADLAPNEDSPNTSAKSFVAVGNIDADTFSPVPNIKNEPSIASLLTTVAPVKPTVSSPTLVECNKPISLVPTD